MVEAAEQDIKRLTSVVCQKSMPIERPGIAKFFKDSQGQTILLGIETKAGVCIEVGTGKEEQDFDQVSSCKAHIKFIKVCSGSTLELKTVNVYIGDITAFNRAEVIVNAANEQLQNYAGIAQAIVKKGGQEIQDDCNEYVRKRGIVPTGTAILRDKIGRLPPPYKAIVHAVGPIWNHSSQNHEREIALLKKACRRALVAASSYGSIAIPAISSGVFGFPINVCADTLVKAVVEFSKQEGYADELCDINFIVFKEKASAFQKAMEEHIKNTTSHEQLAVKNVHSTTSSSAVTARQTSAKRRTPPIVIDPTQRIQPNTLQKIKITKGSILDVQVC